MVTARCPPAPQLQKHKLGGKPPSHPIASPHQMGKQEEERKEGNETDCETSEYCGLISGVRPGILTPGFWLVSHPHDFLGPAKQHILPEGEETSPTNKTTAGRGVAQSLRV